MWRNVLIGALAINAIAGFAYRFYRYRKGGPIGDVWGQAILGLLLLALATATALGAGWPRWPALGYAALFGLAVMPIWTLGVLIPLPPGRLDYAFTALYWVTLLMIGAAAVAL